MEAGYVWVNDVGRHFPGTPFGGYKQSGIGREECLEELISYTQEKSVHIRLLQPKNAVRWSNRGTEERQTFGVGTPGDAKEVIVGRTASIDIKRPRTDDRRVWDVVFGVLWIPGRTSRAQTQTLSSAGKSTSLSAAGV